MATSNINGNSSDQKVRRVFNFYQDLKKVDKVLQVCLDQQSLHIVVSTLVCT